MNLEIAKTVLIADRMDWRKPHLRWVSDHFYRMFSSKFSSK